MSYSKQDLKNLIARGHAADVIAGVVAVTLNLRDLGRMHQSASLLSARWAANELARQRGTVSNADYLLEKNKVTDTLLGFVDEIPEGFIEVQLSESLGSESANRQTSEPLYPPKPSCPPSLGRRGRRRANPQTPKTSNLWKRFGYVGLIVGILAGVVKIVEYFQKPPATVPTQNTVAKPDSLVTPSGPSTSGDQSPAINAPGGDVQINYGTEPEKPAEKKAKKQ